jgi:hypothetical protein
LAIRPDLTIDALKAIARKYPTRSKRDRTLRLTANADGLVIETNQSSAFVVAQVAVAGQCIVSAKHFAAILKTFPPTRPLSVEYVPEQGMKIGKLLIPTPPLLPHDAG